MFVAWAASAAVLASASLASTAPLSNPFRKVAGPWTPPSPPSFEYWPPKPFPESVPRLYPSQRVAVATTTAKAQPASAQAHSEILSLLDSAEMRARLQRCCPHLANASAAVLLDEITANVESAELVHTFDHSLDVAATVEIALNVTNYFPTQWQLRYLGYFGPLWYYGAPFMESSNEEGIFDLKPFSGWHDTPATYEEASARVIYVTLNMLRIDSGNRPFGYGNVTAVLSPSYWNDAVVAAPTDTGFYASCCNTTLQKELGENATMMYEWCSTLIGADAGYNFSKYCHATPWTATPGVNGAMLHALLTNDRARANALGEKRGSTIGRYFERWHGAKDDEALTNITGKETFSYIEANVLANVLYKDRGIKLLVGSFAAMYGTTRGALLQKWAIKQGIALTWALGCGRVDATINMSQPGGHGAYNTSFRGHTRILDAKVSRALQTAPQGPLRSRLNSTVDVKSAEQFKTLWQKMLSMRGPDDSLPQDLVFECWAAMEAAAKPASMQVGLPRPRSCDWEQCVGIAVDGRCVCYV